MIVTKKEAYKQEGMMIFTVPENQMASTVFRLNLINVIDEKILNQVGKSLNSIIAKPNKNTSLIILTKRKFEDFTKLASKSNGKTENITEKHILCNILFTNDDNISPRDIPIYQDGICIKESIYKKDKVYVVRIMAKCKNLDEAKFRNTEDAIIYIPED